MHTMYARRVWKRNNKMCQSLHRGTNSFSPRQPPQMLTLSLLLPPPIEQLWHSNIQARCRWQPGLCLWAPVHACIPAGMCTYEMIRGPEWDRALCCSGCQAFIGDSSSFAEAILLLANVADAVGKPLTSENEGARSRLNSTPLFYHVVGNTGLARRLQQKRSTPSRFHRVKSLRLIRTQTLSMNSLCSQKKSL